MYGKIMIYVLCFCAIQTGFVVGESIKKTGINSDNNIKTTNLPVKTPSKQIEQLHKQAIYPVVRVTSGSIGGSGTIIYSENRSKNDEFENFIATNYHVVEPAIKIEKVWSSMLRAHVQKEKRQTVKVEIFRYNNLSFIEGRQSYDADIVATSKDDDIAILKLRSTRKHNYVAKLLPREKFNEVKTGTEVAAVGCSLLHPPLVTSGQITSLNDEIENKKYWMSNAQIVFGSSGGAVFLVSNNKLNYDFIGIPSRVAVIGWGTPITHMGYFIPIDRIYKWFQEQHLTFFYDKTKTPKECFHERDELAKKAQLMSIEKLRKDEGDTIINSPDPSSVNLLD